MFQVSYVYALPDTLSTCRMLREGGNGIVLEVGTELCGIKVAESVSFLPFCSESESLFILLFWDFY